MIEFKANSFQICDINTLEPIAEFSDIRDVTIESEVEESSLSKEKLSFNHEASFECELTDCSSLLNYVTDFNDKPLYVEYNIPILVQARWHKNYRINKKWIKRYGMKKDNILVRCDVDSFGQNESLDPYGLTEPELVQCNISLNNMKFKFRPDQKRRNLKIEEYYG